MNDGDDGERIVWTDNLRFDVTIIPMDTITYRAIYIDDDIFYEPMTYRDMQYYMCK